MLIQVAVSVREAETAAGREGEREPRVCSTARPNLYADERASPKRPCARLNLPTLNVKLNVLVLRGKVEGARVNGVNRAAVNWF